MKILKVGVYHHECWGSFSTKDFPTISMNEMGAVQIIRKNDKGTLVNSFWKITSDTKKELESYLAYVQKLSSIKKFKIYHKKNSKAYVYIQFLSTTSSYDSVLKTNALPIGPIIQKNELEIHTVACDKPKQTTRFLNELETLGETKVFRISDFEEDNFYSLSQKQEQALMHAYNNNYYTWPKKTSLEHLSKKLGVKRRTFQERLRIAESKLIPTFIEKFLQKKRS